MCARIWKGIGWWLLVSEMILKTRGGYKLMDFYLFRKSITKYKKKSTFYGLHCRRHRASRRPTSPRTTGDPGQSRPPAPATTSRHSLSSLACSGRRQTTTTQTKTMTQRRRLLADYYCTDIFVTVDSQETKWLLFRRITGSKFNLLHLRCSAAMEAGEGTLPPPV